MDFLRAQLDPCEGAGVADTGNEDQVEATAFHLVLQPIAVALEKTDLRFGMSGAKTANELRDEDVAERAQESNGYTCAASFVAVAKLLITILDDPECAFDIAEKNLSVRGETDRATAAFEQRNANLGLERRYRATQRGLAQPEFQRCLGDVLGSPHRPEILQPGQIHSLFHRGVIPGGLFNLTCTRVM